MPRVPTNGIELDYQEYGEGEAIVFCHGAGGNLLSWWQQIRYFSKSYRCITFSHRGFGHSYDVPDGPGMKSFVEDLAALLDHLEVESAHLVSQSMGGRTALGFAVEHTTPHPQPRACRHDWRHGRTRRRAGARRVVETSDIGPRAWLPGSGP